ncbi:MAG: DEAD/DEAH box helicase [Xanthomonadales bacterium]|nr:DEAD/DEAH box helicase [Xanthomonadales bacterium]
MELSAFHPAVRSWFDQSFEHATPVQEEAWRKIGSEQNILVAAPTGSGKTFAAFLCAINDLVEQGARGPLAEGVQVLYVSPLKALSNDIEKNLREPLAGIDGWLEEKKQPASGIRAMVRTGDTPPGDRQKMRRKPPQILVTTPESLYLLLTSDSGRGILSGVSTVIVDEIHAIAGSKRGSHLSLSLARLDALTLERNGVRARRIGLSATQKPIGEIASFLSGGEPCAIVDTGHQRERDLAIEIPASPLSPVLSAEVWEEIYDRIESLVDHHRTTLIFVNTRRLCERMAKHLAERLGEDAVTAHHGSLARDHRLEAEQALKGGRLRALVATASLELGIDIGHVDLVIQVGSPGGISQLIQRVGRAGHAVGETPKGRLFPVSRDDLVECVALLQAVNEGQLDTILIPLAPLDVLSQQLVAEISARDWDCDALFAQVCQAWPYRDIERDDFDEVVHMLATGFATRRGRRSAYIHHDAVNGRVRARRSARLAALQNGGAIPDQFDQDVILMPQGYRIGTLNEDFAFESMAGDIFQLGNTSYRILKVETGKVLVEDAHGQPPTIPFWVGDAPGRSDELSQAVSDLRRRSERLLRQEGKDAAMQWLQETGIDPAPAAQTVEYLAAARDALGCLPTDRRVVLERFFDDTGDMHLVVHAPLGSRIMRAWGLSLRKRFCRQFNFELQASALEDSLILSLGETHSFESSQVPGYLKPETVRNVLVQALLDAPLFEVRWRWNATISLAVQRMRNGQRLPPQWQRNNAEDLVAVVFPDQLACLENIRGEREVPDHPLVRQTLDDCLTEAMDIAGLVEVLKGIEAGDISVRCVDLNGPSPLAAEIINARPYAFLDDGEAEERRTRAISQGPDDLGSAATLSIISVEATQQVRSEAWIRPRNPDELHDGLLQLGFLCEDEFHTGTCSTGTPSDAAQWPNWFRALAGELRACTTQAGGRRWWVATERLCEFLALHPKATLNPDPRAAFAVDDVDPDRALIELLRARLSGLGPVDEARLAGDFGLPGARVNTGLLALQAEGFALTMNQGRSDDDKGKTWCERRLLARIHRYSRERRRRAAKPVPPTAFMRFLLHWHGFDEPVGELEQALGQLEGWVAPAVSWETGLLARRCADYAPQRLDEQFLSGYLTWFRPAVQGEGAANLVAATPIAFVPRTGLDAWRLGGAPSAESLGSTAERIVRVLERHGAMFTADIAAEAGLLPMAVEQGIAELVARGIVTADAFSPLRWLIRPEAEKRRQQKRLSRARRAAGPTLLGRWSLPRPAHVADEETLFRDQARLSTVCSALLRRYGVVFRALLERESLTPPWRYLLNYFRRMEDRGEVQGGRFVEGFSGEQFALPEAVGLLRRQLTEARGDAPHVIHAADPLNLGGILTPGVKTPSRPGNRILLQNGEPVARILGDELEILGRNVDMTEAERHLRIVRPFAKAGRFNR